MRQKKKIIDENYKIEMPDISKISDDDKINGILSDVSMSSRY